MEKIKKGIHRICEVLELLAAGLVLIGILFSAFSLLRQGQTFQQLLQDTSGFIHYLEQVLMLVIGIEFLQMLCRPNADNVMEILIFLVARHMIVGTTTTFEDFVSLISVTLLFVLRRYLHNLKIKEDKASDETQYCYVVNDYKAADVTGCGLQM